MFASYEEMTLLVSRRFCHGEGGLQDHGYQLFSSFAEYTRQARGTEVSLDGCWATYPVEVQASVNQEGQAALQRGEPLSLSQVRFSGADIDTIAATGRGPII